MGEEAKSSRQPALDSSLFPPDFSVCKYEGSRRRCLLYSIIQSFDHSVILGSNNTKHPHPVHSANQLATHGRLCIGFARPQRAFAQQHLDLLLDLPVSPHPPPLLTTTENTTIVWLPSVAIDTQHSTAPHLSRLQRRRVCCFPLSGAERPSLSLQPLRSLSPHVPSSIFAETLRPPANTLVLPTSALYHRPCHQHMVSHSTVCPTPSHPPSSSSGPPGLPHVDPIRPEPIPSHHVKC